MTTRFLLVRHATCAQTDSVLLGRACDEPLDRRGVAQAESLGASLAPGGAARILASPRRRAGATAAAIAATVRVPVEVDAAFDEVDFGRWCGRTFAALEADPDWRTWNAHRATARTPAGESLADVQERAWRALSAAAAANAEPPVIVVTHAEVIRALLLRALDWPLEDWPRLDVPPASVSRLTLRGTVADVVTVGEAAHLAGAA
jgi:broad specificity phosphatase PhoE